MQTTTTNPTYCAACSLTHPDGQHPTIITGYHRPEFSPTGLFRDQTYRGIYESVLAVSTSDVSPTHSILTYVPNGYDSRCGSCWYGHGHTDDFHAREIASVI